MKKLLSILSLTISLMFAVFIIPVFAQSPASVTIVGHAFNPTEVTIPTGGRVVWNNIDAVTHTVTADAGQSMTFNSGDLSLNQSYSVTFNSPGVYTYHDAYFSWMTGRVVVQGEAIPTAVPGTSTVTPPPATATQPPPGIPSTGGSAPRDSGSSMPFLLFTAVVGAFGAAAVGLRFWSRGR